MRYDDNAATTPDAQRLERYQWVAICAGIVVLAFADYVSTKNYLLFHTFAEGFTIIVSFTIALIVFHNYRYLSNPFIPILGVAYACAGVFDALHTVAYKGLGILPAAGANLPTQLWLIARYLDATGMFLAGLSQEKTIKLPYVLAAYVALSGAALLAVFYWHVFPVCYADGQGLTAFKIYSEYIICLILIAGLVLLIRRRNHFRPQVYRYLLPFFLVSVGTELTMTTYVQVYGFSITFGHLLKISAFFFLYRAVIATCLKDPYIQLERREREYRTLLDHCPYMLSRFDRQLQYLYANPAHEIASKIPAGKAIGKTWAELGLSGENYALLVDKYMQVINTGEQLEFETTLPDEQGRARYYHISVVPEKNEHGYVESVLAITHDITAQKQSEECFAKAFHINPHIMMITSLRDGRYIDVNESFVQAAGLSRDIIIQRTTAELNLWHDSGEQQKIMDILNKQGSIFNREITYHTVSAGLRTGLLSADKISINNTPCVLSVITDITEKRQLENEMSRYACLDVVGELAAGLGHEIRNPLTIVRGYLQVLQGQRNF